MGNWSAEHNLALFFFLSCFLSCFLSFFLSFTLSFFPNFHTRNGDQLVLSQFFSFSWCFQTYPSSSKSLSRLAKDKFNFRDCHCEDRTRYNLVSRIKSSTSFSNELGFVHNRSQRDAIVNSWNDFTLLDLYNYWVLCIWTFLFRSVHAWIRIQYYFFSMIVHAMIHWQLIHIRKGQWQIKTQYIVILTNISCE